jgi:hypothetical protein
LQNNVLGKHLNSEAKNDDELQVGGSNSSGAAQTYSPGFEVDRILLGNVSK